MDEPDREREHRGAPQPRAGAERAQVAAQGRAQGEDEEAEEQRGADQPGVRKQAHLEAMSPLQLLAGVALAHVELGEVVLAQTPERVGTQRTQGHAPSVIAPAAHVGEVRAG